MGVTEPLISEGLTQNTSTITDSFFIGVTEPLISEGLTQDRLAPAEGLPPSCN